MKLVPLVLAVIDLHAAYATVRSPKTKAAPKEKPINWNLSYYSEPFGLCKPLKILNPVEQVRAHGFAVDVFFKCGPTFVVPYAQRYNFPAYAIEKAVEIFCYIGNLAGGYCDLKSDACVDEQLRQLRIFCQAWKVSNFSARATYRNETFFITAEMCHGFVYEVIECALRKTSIRQSDYAKYTALHFKKMLL